MSVDLNVWSNHKLTFSSFAEGLEMFESKIGKKIGQEIFETDKIDEITEIQYFTDFETLKHNFKRHNQIKISTNFAYCRELVLYGKTVNFKPRGFYTRFTRWKKLVGGNSNDEDEKTIAQFRENWKLFRNFAINLTKKLGGNRIIYIDDNLQRQEDAFREGYALDYGIKPMQEICESFELGLLELCPSEFDERRVWFYEDLD